MTDNEQKALALLTLMVRRVGSALRHQRDKGNAVSVDQIGNYQLWQINR
jgi:hypothetical protein